MDTTEIIYCPNCGTASKNNQNFCMNCGKALNSPNTDELEDENENEANEYLPEDKLPIRMLFVTIILFLQTALLFYIGFGAAIWQDIFILLGFDRFYITLTSFAFAVLGISTIMTAVGIIRNDRWVYNLNLFCSIIIIPLCIYGGVHSGSLYLWLIVTFQIVSLVVLRDEFSALKEIEINENETTPTEQKSSTLTNIVTLIGILLILVLILLALFGK